MATNTSRPTKGSKVTTTSARVRAAKAAAAAKPKKQKLAPVRLIFIMDRSTSMTSMREEAINGFNTFLQGQQDLPGKATFSFVLFDTDVVVVYDKADIKKVPKLDYGTYIPRGMTALYDAIGLTVDRYKKDSKAEKTIVAILTDGEENSSRQYAAHQVHQMLKDVQDEGEWEVMFLGANLDSKKFAAQVGIKLNNTANYDYTKKGMFDAINTVNFAASAMRGASLSVGGAMMSAKNLDMTTLYNSVKNGDTVVDPVSVTVTTTTITPAKKAPSAASSK